MSLPPYGGKEVQLQEHRPRDSHSGWTERWGPVNRMRFFQQALNVQATRDQGVEYLRRRHAAFVPEALLAPKEADSGERPKDEARRSG